MERALSAAAPGAEEEWAEVKARVAARVKGAVGWAVRMRPVRAANACARAAANVCRTWRGSPAHSGIVRSAVRQ